MISWNSEKRDRPKGAILEGQEETHGAEEYAHNTDCDDGMLSLVAHILKLESLWYSFTGVCIYQNL